MKLFFFFGDSLTLGVNDPEQLGWVGRLAAGSGLPVPPTTFYNLGARKHTSRSVLERWKAETDARTLPDVPVRLLFCVGVVDMVAAGNSTVIPAAASAANLTELLARVGKEHAAQAVRVLSPFPVAQQEFSQRIETLGTSYAEVCRAANVEYVDIFSALRQDSRYLPDLADGLHPGSAGCAVISELLLRHPSMERWLHE